MRITFVSPVGEIGGAERVMLGLLGALRHVHDVSVVLMSDGPLRGVVAQLGVPVLVVGLPDDWQATGEQQAGLPGAPTRIWTAPRRAFGLWQYVRRLREVLRNLSPDIVHTNGMKAHLAAARAMPAGAKLVWHLHDYLSRRRWSRRLLRFAVRRADLAVAISTSVADDAHRCLPGLPIAVVPNFTDTVHFQPGPAGLDLDAEAGLSPAGSATVRVGLVATYAIWKGHLLFLEALRHAVGQLGAEAVRGYVVGGPIYRTSGRSQITATELRARIHDLQLEEVVGLVPFQADPLDAYRALDVVVHASTAPEPFGLTITEAMACRRAVVAANAGGPREIVTHERDGLLYEPGNAEALAAAIVRLVREAELRDRLGRAARETVLERYQLPAATATLAAAYRRLLGDRGEASSARG